jgi:hypothetical protein
VAFREGNIMSTTDIVCELHEIETRIRKSEGESVIDRWKFGRVLIALRGGKKQLPRGLREEITEQFGLEASELTRRMKLADTFATCEEVVDACTRCGGSWRRIIREALPKRETAAKPKPTWDERISKRLNRIIDDAETEDELKTLAELFRKALERVEPSQEVAA